MSLVRPVVERWQRKEASDLVERLTLPGDRQRDRIATAALALAGCLWLSIFLGCCS